MGKAAVVAGLALAALPACSQGASESSSSPVVTIPPVTTTAVAVPSTSVPDADGTVVAAARNDELVARVEPDAEADPVAVMANPVPTGGPLVVRVLTPVESADDDWLEVMLPVKPNGTTGWIRGDDVDLSLDPYRIAIDTSEHRLDVYESDELVLSTTIGVGTGDTPTPYGDFYLAELLRPPDPTGPYGPYAFGLNGFSEVLDDFNGGDGVIGIHGTDEPAALGTDVSHGCLRVENSIIEEMASTLPLGTPVEISH